MRLPWVVLNNQGILHFLAGDIRKAAKAYQELNERIPNNIVFLYRLGLCLILDGFQKPRRTLFGKLKPDRIKIEKGVALFRHCLKLAESRPVGRQKCLVIRKILADVLERTGRASEARGLWKDIKYQDPSCAEAAYKLKHLDLAKRIAKTKQEIRDERAQLNPKSANSLRLKSGSPRKT